MNTQLGTALLAVILLTSPGMADDLTFYPTDDAWIVMSSPGSNYGSCQNLSVRNRYGAGGSSYWERDALIRFDVSSIPVGMRITSATLHLYYYRWEDNNPAGRDLTCYRATSGWDEETVTWDTRPSMMSVATDSSVIPAMSGHWLDWDVTSDVQAFVNDPLVDNYGWQIMDEEPWGWCNIPIADFRSKEFGAFTPYLTVVPEPGTATLLLAGGLALIRRRRPW
ncbi:MAG: DNRLRE domain-containing protein [Phycisphaerae bacterium]|nr:DNRLRE domain-containing protein [Phycisphaerae bacterium]